jgi:hypothetical protein
MLPWYFFLLFAVLLFCFFLVFDHRQRISLHSPLACQFFERQCKGLFDWGAGTEVGEFSGAVVL